jgi:3-deoxy-D-manno-octulosonate 8-phosphate phosphatase KdsC-like HAD superfamily phosphatase
LEEAVARTTRLEHKKLLSEKRCKELQQQVREGEKEKQQTLEDLKYQMQLEAQQYTASLQEFARAETARRFGKTKRPQT